jgi:hypothetical protein
MYWNLDKYNDYVLKREESDFDDKTMKIIGHICKSIINAKNKISKIDSSTKEGKEILEYKGYTGTNTRHFYNNICSNYEGQETQTNYLEIGTWYGSSSISAIYKNKIDALFIDNWCQFNGDANIFIENIEKFKGDCDCSLIESDCWGVDLKCIPYKFNIYLYDGAHTEEDHYKSLEYYLPILEDQFIFIVDDWCWSEVRNGTMRAIRDLNLNIQFKHEEILSSEEVEGMPNHIGKNTWWNGIGIFLLSK